MSGTEGEIVLTRDDSSGRIHKRIRTAAGLVPYGGEADNTDQAGTYEIVDSLALVNAERSAICDRCFTVQDFPDRTVWFEGDDAA